MLPADGACAVFTIDPVASLDPEIQEDPEAVAACKRLANKKYGVIVDRQALYEPWEPYNPCFVRFLLQGEPLTSEERSIEPTMSVPIAPTVTRPHVSARDPIKASKPLPWNDCYVTCYTYAEVKSPTESTEKPVDYELSLEEFNRLDRLLRQDVERKKDLLWERAEREKGQFLALVRKPSLLLIELLVAHASPLEASAQPLESDLKRRVVAVNFTHDLSTMDELTDPEDYFKEVEAIIRIEEDVRPRVARAKALAVEAARKEAERIECSNLR
ncbi:hypothetical protein C8R46DRAFT_1049226 [Mycena filopes]|nr:hypothetical protein C8R46DRAFT_1049226 [Mycena filopes]